MELVESDHFLEMKHPDMVYCQPRLSAFHTRVVPPATRLLSPTLPVRQHEYPQQLLVRALGYSGRGLRTGCTANALHQELQRPRQGLMLSLVGKTLAHISQQIVLLAKFNVPQQEILLERLEEDQQAIQHGPIKVFEARVDGYLRSRQIKTKKALGYH